MVILKYYGRAGQSGTGSLKVAIVALSTGYIGMHSSHGSICDRQHAAAPAVTLPPLLQCVLDCVKSSSMHNMPEPFSDRHLPQTYSMQSKGAIVAVSGCMVLAALHRCTLSVLAIPFAVSPDAGVSASVCL